MLLTALGGCRRRRPLLAVDLVVDQERADQCQGGEPGDRQPGDREAESGGCSAFGR
jgi:hypothetical protein